MNLNSDTITHGRVKPGMFPGITFEAGDNVADLDFDTLNDEDLDQQLAGLGGDTPAPAAAAAGEPGQDQAQQQADQPPGEVAAGDPAPPNAQDPAQPENPQDPDQAPRHVPLSEHIALRRRAQEAERALEEHRRKEAEAAAKQQTDAEEREYTRLLEQEGPEAAAEYARKVSDRRAEDARREAANQVSQREQQAVIREMELSEKYFVKSLGEGGDQEYQRQFNKVVEKLGADETFRLASRQAAEGKDAAEWIFNFGKSMETPEERQTTIQAEVAKQVQAALAKHQPPTAPGASSVAHLPASTQTPTVLNKDPDDMSDEELDAELARRKSR